MWTGTLSFRWATTLTILPDHTSIYDFTAHNATATIPSPRSASLSPRPPNPHTLPDPPQNQSATAHTADSPPLHNRLTAITSRLHPYSHPHPCAAGSPPISGSGGAAACTRTAAPSAAAALSQNTTRCPRACRGRAHAPPPGLDPCTLHERARHHRVARRGRLGGARW